MNPAKVAVFIDASNVFYNIKEIKKADPAWISFYDPLKLAEKLAGNRKLVSVKYYCVHPPQYLLKRREKIYNFINKYHSAIENLPLLEIKYGYLKNIKGLLFEKNIDTQIATDMVTEAALDKYDTAILVANDGDYVSPVKSTKENFSKKIELVYFKGSLSMNLKKISDVPRRARRSYFQPLEGCEKDEEGNKQKALPFDVAN